MGEQVAEDVAQQTKDAARVEWLGISSADIVHAYLTGVREDNRYVVISSTHQPFPVPVRHANQVDPLNEIIERISVKQRRVVKCLDCYKRVETLDPGFRSIYSLSIQSSGVR